MGKATKIVSGRYCITKRLTTHIGAAEILIGAAEILNFVLAVAAYEENKARKWIEEQAACDVITGYFYEPYADKHSRDETINKYLEHLKKSLDFCIKKFPDIPSEEFKKEYYFYKGFLD